MVSDCSLGLVMVAMLAWAFIRYTGRYQHVGGTIDQAAGVVLEQVRRKKKQFLFKPKHIMNICFKLMHLLLPLEGAVDEGHNEMHQYFILFNLYFTKKISLRLKIYFLILDIRVTIPFYL